MKIAYLFPDTNLFIQCRSLDQIDWSAWEDFDEVHLYVSRPIQIEIDKHKNQGKGRPAKRGRTTASRFRDVIKSEDNFIIVREGAPLIKLFLKIEIPPSTSISLDYSHSDNQLVGITHAFAASNPDSYVRVLTHDIGPLMSAKTFNVGFYEIPDDWLLPAEESEADKKVTELEKQICNLRKSEPQFQVRSIYDNAEVKTLELDYIRYDALTEDEVSDMLRRLESQFPIHTDFGSKNPIERSSFGMLLEREIFTPATAEEIVNYQDKEYPSWRDKCEEVLRRYHKILQHQLGQPTCEFSIANMGTRPADDALVTLVAKGDIEIMPPQRQEGDTSKKESANSLPLPPSPPRGHWKTKNIMAGFSHPFSGMEFLNTNSLDIMSPLRRPTPIDPNGFYYKPERPSLPVERYSLECKQWRHAVEPEWFKTRIHFPLDRDKISGALECRVHAANLSDSLSITVPVRIQIITQSAYPAAKEALEKLSMQYLLKRRAG
jgi:hypothetical protein